MRTQSPYWTQGPYHGFLDADQGGRRPGVTHPTGGSGSSFPDRWPAADEQAVGCHLLDTSEAFVPAPAKVATGPGWQVNESRGVAGMSGMAHGAAASLAVKLDNGKVHIALTNRGIPIEEVNGRVLDALAGS